jgi:hypothetical protein
MALTPMHNVGTMRCSASWATWVVSEFASLTVPREEGSLLLNRRIKQRADPPECRTEGHRTRAAWPLRACLPLAAVLVVASNLGCAAMSVASGNGSGTTPEPSSAAFSTLPPGSTLPTDAECAARVRPAPEVRPQNAPYNAARGVQKNLTGPSPLFGRVDGNFTGTTDEIIQWTACKWGVDEDIVRAQAVVE